MLGVEFLVDSTSANAFSDSQIKDRFFGLAKVIQLSISNNDKSGSPLHHLHLLNFGSKPEIC